MSVTESTQSDLVGRESSGPSIGVYLLTRISYDFLVGRLGSSLRLNVCRSTRFIYHQQCSVIQTPQEKYVVLDYGT